MEIVIKSKNLDVPDGLRSYVEDKTSRLDRYLHNIDEAQMDLRVENARSAQDRQIAQLTLRTKSGSVLRVEERSADIRTSIDLALDKMSRQLGRYKGKHWQSQVRAAVHTIPAPEAPEPEPEIVRVKRFQTRPMDVEEAIEQMEMLGHDFFAFYDMESSAFSVVYKRRDGGYGLLLPELA
ncbi:MAG: ribosome-associated translation inhibitor RaiA [Chloroflexota bacterium]